MSAVLLEAQGLTVDRGTGEILHGVDLTLRAGEALALVGPNAAGKSTLVRTLAGLLAPSRGRVTLEGRALASWPRARLAREIALVTPEEEGLPALGVEDRVALGRYPHRGPFRPFTAADRAAVARALEQTGIAPLARRRLGTLSAGERQLAALARGLAQEPRVLLLDEPAAHLDIGHQLRLFRVLDDVRACGVAVLAVVHDLPRAAAWAERMVLLAGGRVAAEGDPAAVLASPAAARAFDVRVVAHSVPGLAHALYSFDDGAPGAGPMVALTPLDLRDRATAEALLDVQRRAYRVEAELIGFDGIPPLHEDLAALQACGEEFLGRREDGRITAAISWKREGDTLDIHRLVVDPAYFRRGLGRELVRAVLARPGFARVIVSTGEANWPARRLYEAEGFRVVATVRIAEGVNVVRLARDARRAPGTTAGVPSLSVRRSSP